MQFIRQITRFVSYLNTLPSRILLLIVLSSALLAVQLAAPPAASAFCDGGCTPGTCCDDYCQVFCCNEDPYEYQCYGYCWYCVPECQPCCS